MKSKLFALVTILAISTLFGACGSGTTGGGGIGPSGTVTLTVKPDTASPNKDFSNLVITVTGAASPAPQKPDSFGSAAFPGLPTGAYTVTVAGLGFVTTTQSVSVTQSMTLPVTLTAKSDIIVTDISPASGTTLKCTDKVTFKLVYAIDQSYEAPVIVGAFLSKNGQDGQGMEGTIGSCSSSIGLSGTVTCSAFVLPNYCQSPVVVNYIIARITAGPCNSKETCGANYHELAGVTPAYQVTFQP